MRRRLPILTILLVLSPAVAGAERPLFTAFSDHRERPSQHEVRPRPALVRPLLASHAWVEASALDACLAESHSRPGDYGSLLRAIRVHSRVGRTLGFLRGALEPW